MTVASVPVPKPIAAVLADVESTQVTRAKVVTARAVKAIENCTSGPSAGDAWADGCLQRQDHCAAQHDP
jgi:hypothetical protein